MRKNWWQVTRWVRGTWHPQRRTGKARSDHVGREVHAIVVLAASAGILGAYFLERTAVDRSTVEADAAGKERKSLD